MNTKLKTLVLLCGWGCLAVSLQAVVSYTPSYIAIQDSSNGSIVNVDVSTFGTSSQTIFYPAADLNLYSFQVGSTVYQASDFISGVGGETVLDTSVTERVLQPAGYAAAHPNYPYYADPTVPSGPLPNAVSYLTQGERGLSFSSGLNYTASGSPGGFTISIDLHFRSDPRSATRPTFFAGDGVNNQGIDVWSFYDVNNVLVARITSVDADDLPNNGEIKWTKFAQQEVDRLNTDDASLETLKTLEMSFLAFSLEDGDFESGHTWDEISRLEISSNGAAKTDWAFFGIDSGIVSAPSAVVPEVSFSTMFAGLACLVFVVFRHRR